MYASSRRLDCLPMYWWLLTVITDFGLEREREEEGTREMATTTTSFRKTTLSHAQKTVLAMSRTQYLDAIRATRPADKLYVGVCIFRMDAHSSRPSVLLLRRSSSSNASSSSSNGGGGAAITTTTTSATPSASDPGASTAATASSSSSSSRWQLGRRSHQSANTTNSNGNGNGNGEAGRRRTEDEGGGGREDGRKRDRDRERGTRGGGSGSGIWELPGGKVRESDFCISAAVARRVAEQTGLRVVRVLGALQDVRRVSETRILDWDEDGVGIFNSYYNGGNMLFDGNGNGSGSASNLSVLDGATLTSVTSTSVSASGTAGSGSVSSVGGIIGGGGGGGSGSGGSGGNGTGGFRNSDPRRSPIHNPQLVLRKECLQLNYAVLVQSHEDLTIRSREHDEMVWASFSRAEALLMPDELRTVVHQGLAFAGEYLF
ncbi:hypothetical protein M426DRAFT_19469 [Hypoxylon sp. CI-4A]|nr:hypothetical protein M426DRAFT_19469 [Hypoxylon sp. CI-4A]